MKSLVEAAKAQEMDAEPIVILSNDPSAAGLDFAKEQGIATEIVDHKAFDNRESFEDAILEALSKYKIDLICLAGFMRILTPHFLNSVGVPIINIHPSLLPKYKGLNTHQRALDVGDTESGCTVHYVVPDIDSGEIIVQKSVPIEQGDTAETLAARVLVEEHKAYLDAVQIVMNKLKHNQRLEA